MVRVRAIHITFHLHYELGEIHNLHAMKVSTLALALALSIDGSAAFRPSHSFHQPSRLHLSPFAQVAQLIAPTEPVNGSKKPAHVVDEPSDGPGCIRKADFDNETVKITYRNQAHLHEQVGASRETKTAAEATPVKTVSAPEPTSAEELDSVDKEEKVYGVVNTKKLSKLYDLVVIGGGPAGVAGAIKAAQMGRRAILIDKVRNMHCLGLAYMLIVIGNLTLASSQIA